MKTLAYRFFAVLVLILGGCICLAAQRDQASKKTEAAPVHPDTSASRSGDRISDALKEALQLSATRAVAATGRQDGFLGNEAIRILLPPQLQSLGKAMRLIGEGDTVDDLEIGMNRAAERAAPAAKQIFLEALRNMSFTDARGILTGGETAATEYFRQNSSADLTLALTPIVHNSLQRVGVIRKYNYVIKTAPGARVIANDFDMDKYVVAKTLDGIFYVLAQEEAKIRTTPAAQTTALLKEVFAKK